MKIKNPKKVNERKPKTDLSTLRLSQSAISRFQECRQKAKLVLEGWYSTKPVTALRYGKHFHAGLEAVTAESMRIKSPPSDEFIDLAMGKIFQNWKLDFEKSSEKPRKEKDLQSIRETVQAEMFLIASSLKQYVKYYKSDFNGKKNWTSLEKKFEVAYKGITLLGYIDAVYEEKKRHHIFETKTRSKVSGDMVDILHLDFQTFFYIHGFYLATGIFPVGISYNVVKKFQCKIKVDESAQEYAKRYEIDIAARPDFYFTRINAEITKKEYIEWVKDNLDPLIDDYKDWRSGKGRHYCNTTNCDGKYGSCDFLPICSIGNYQGFKKKDFKKGKGGEKQ